MHLDQLIFTVLIVWAMTSSGFCTQNCMEKFILSILVQMSKIGYRGANVNCPSVWNDEYQQILDLCVHHKFCRSSPYGLIIKYDVSYMEVMRSYWFAVDMIN